MKPNYKDIIHKRVRNYNIIHSPIDIGFECDNCDVSWIVPMKIVDRDMCPICGKWKYPSQIDTNLPYQKVRFSKYLDTIFVKNLVDNCNTLDVAYLSRKKIKEINI